MVELHVDEAFDLDAVLAGHTWAVDECEQVERHVDTRRLRLLALGHTLAQVTDTRGTRWVLHLAGSDDPITFIASGDDVPPVLAQLLFGVTAGRPLTEIATLTSHHRHSAVSIGDGATDVSIDDDVVAGPDGFRRRRVRLEFLSGDTEQYTLALARLR